MTYIYSETETLDVVLNNTDLQLVGNEKSDENVTGQYVNPDDVIMIDGYPRDVITINGKFPGPTIEVLEGTEVLCHGMVFVYYYSSRRILYIPLQILKMS